MTDGMTEIRLDGVSLAYAQAGHGPPLVLLHGFLCDARCWRRQLADLSSDFTVIAWDAPGAGRSSDPPDTFTLADWSRCLEQFLDVLGIEQPHLLGLSWGGVLAQEFYHRHPDRVARLVLADTYAGWSGSFAPSIVSQRLSRCEHDSHLAPDDFAARWVPEMFSAAASPALLTELATVFGDFHPHGFRLMAKSLADADTRALLARIDVPTLLLWGEHDTRSPVSVAHQIQSAIPRCELQLIPHAGHVSNMEQPAAFNAHVRQFCSAD
jgi:pimeloyl-ACP methyl ester carboxylesterase